MLFVELNLSKQYSFNKNHNNNIIQNQYSPRANMRLCFFFDSFLTLLTSSVGFETTSSFSDKINSIWQGDDIYAEMRLSENKHAWHNEFGVY